MDYILWTTIITITLALIFDLSNGFHDAANATSTVIATKSLKPKTIGRMIGSWIVTLPSAAVVGYITYKATVLPGAPAAVVTGLLIIALLIYAIRLMFTATTAEDVERALPQDVEQVIPLLDK